MHLKRPLFFSFFCILIITLTLSGCGKGSKEDKEVKPVRVDVTGSTTNTSIGNDIQLTATLTYSDTSGELATSKANWQSSDIKVATVTTAGIATCIKEGTSTLTASYEDFTGNLVVTCLPKPFIKTLTFTQEKTDVDENLSLQYSAVAKLSNDDPAPSDIKYIWSIDKPEIATIDENGKIMGVSHGFATISLTIDEENTDILVKLDKNPITRKITVNPVTNAISISKTESPVEGDLIYNLELGESANLVVLNHKTDGTTPNITQRITEWENESPGVILIDGTGVIKTKAIGTTIIKVKSYNKYASRNSATIHVEKPLELYVTHDTAGQIRLNWNELQFKTTEYQLEWKTTEETDFHDLISTTGTSYIHTIADTTKTYEYQIAYKKADGSYSDKHKTLTQVKPHLSTWEKKNNFPARSHASSAIVGDKIYVFGGEITTTVGDIKTASTSSEIWEYTISTHHWELKTNMLTPRQDAAICEVNGYAFLFGGFDLITGQVLSDIFIYHTSSGLPPNVEMVGLNFPERKGASCATDGSTLYVSGGTDGATISNKIFRFAISFDGDNITLTQLSDIDLPPQSTDMSVARYAHQSLVFDDKLYIAGGLTIGDIATPTLEIMDLSTTQWISLVKISEMSIARYDFSLKIIRDRIYAIGGKKGAGDILLNSVEILDPSSDFKSWITGDPMPFANSGFISEYQSSNETLYIFGGDVTAISASNGNANQMLYSGKSLSWHPLLNSADGIYDTSAGIIGDIVYLIGGREEDGKISDKTQAYSISQNSWITASSSPAPLTTPRVNSATLSAKNLIFSIGGIDKDKNILATFEVYGLSATPNSWEEHPKSMNHARADACAVFYDNYIYVLGGVDKTGLVNTIERFSLTNNANNSWEDYGTLPRPRGGLSCATIKDNIYLIGGYEDFTNKLSVKKVESFSPKTKSLNTSLRAMEEARIKPAVSVYNDRIYVFSGISGKLTDYIGTTTSEIYTPFSNIWTDLEPLPIPPELPNIDNASNNPYSAVVGNKIYVFANNHLTTSAQGASSETRRNSTNIYVLE